MTTLQTEPLPCPFCGTNAKFMPFPMSRDDESGIVCCRNRACQAIGPRGADEKEAIFRWNDRAKRVAGPVLTDEQIRLIAINMPNDELEAVLPFARAIESAVLAKLKEQS